MKTVTKVLLGLVAIAVLVIGWWLDSPLFLNETVDEGLPPVTESMESTPDSDATVPEAPSSNPTFVGQFMDGEKNYETTGNILTVEAEDGTYLRFEDFETTNGPDLFVYLVEPGAETDTGIRLGALKGNIGSQNYQVRDQVDLNRHSTVVIWCRTFDADFGVGTLTPRD